MAKKQKVNPVFTAPTRDLRKLKPKELKRLRDAELKATGAESTKKYSPKSEMYVLRGKRVTRSTGTLAKRQYLKRQTAERENRPAVSLEKAARERRTGEYGYGTAAAESQAVKQRSSRALKRLEKVRTVKDNSGQRYHPGLLGHYEELRRRKLEGEDLDQGVWFELIQIAEEIDDPMLSHLLESPRVRPARRRAA